MSKILYHKIGLDRYIIFNKDIALVNIKLLSNE